MQLYNAPIPLVAMENPKGWLGQAFRTADQYINPYQFGEPIRKRTDLWLKGLPLLHPTNVLPKPEALGTDPAKVKAKHPGKALEKARHFVDTAKDWKSRSRFFVGIADAMAQQWGDVERLGRAAAKQGQLF